MSPVFLHNIGVNLWEQVESIGDTRCATVTVLHASVSELDEICHISDLTIKLEYEYLIKWRSAAYIASRGVQEFKLIKKLSADLLEGDVLKKNRNTGIYSYLKNLSGRGSRFNLNSISQCRYAFLMLTKSNVGLDLLWDICCDADMGVSSEFIFNMLNGMENMIVCRVVEGDTHAVIQFIGRAKEIDDVVRVFRDLGLKKITEDAVADVIRGFN